MTEVGRVSDVVVCGLPVLGHGGDMPSPPAASGDRSERVLPAVVRTDRAVGAIVASAAGDALGAPHEFGPALDPSTTLEMTGGGVLGWDPGEWTDDTQTALAGLAPLSAGVTAEQLVDAAAEGLLSWFATNPPDVGNQSRAVLSAATELERPLQSVSAMWCAGHPEASGNGSLMRTGPVALVHGVDRRERADLASTISALTHASEDARDACVLWTDAVARAITDAPGPEADFDWVGHVQAGLDLVRVERQMVWEQRFDEVREQTPEDFTPNGYVVTALQAALAALAHTAVPTVRPAGHLRLAIERAVRIGDDTDTVAAICGALAGARWGGSAVPLAWRRTLSGRTPAAGVVQTAADLECLGRLAFNGGSVDRAGWPEVASMLPAYEAVWPATPVVGALDEYVNIGNVFAVRDQLAQTDTVVSLCRMGRDDVGRIVAHHVVGLIDTNAEENPNLGFVLYDTAEFVADEVAQGRRVFLHCVMAHNRTPTVAAAYLMRTQGLGVEAALGRAREITGTTPREFLIAGLEQLGAEE